MAIDSLPDRDPPMRMCVGVIKILTEWNFSVLSPQGVCLGEKEMNFNNRCLKKLIVVSQGHNSLCHCAYRL